MELWDHLLSPETAARLLLTLLHFLWQGALLPWALAITLRGIPAARVRERYAVNLVVLGMMLICPVVTFRVIELGQSPSAFGGQATIVSPSNAPAVSIRIGDSRTLLAPEMRSKLEIPAPPAGEPEARVKHRLVPSPVSSSGPAAIPGQFGVLGLWMLGVCTMALRLVLSFIWTVLLHQRKQAVEDTLLLRLEKLAREIGLSAIPRIWLSPRVRQAIVTGYLRPAIWLPVSWASELPPEVLEAVLAHELAHIKRWDVWTILLQRVTETLLFYHPGVWWVSRSLSRQRELCCDTAAVQVTKSPRQYAAALERIAHWQWSARNPALTPSLGGSKMELLARVKHVLTLSPESPPRSAVISRHQSGVLVASLLALVTVSSVIFANGTVQTEQKPATVEDSEESTVTDQKPAQKSATEPARTAARARLVAKRILPKDPNRSSLFDLRLVQTLDDQLLSDLSLLSDEAQSVFLGKSLTGKEQLRQLTTLEQLEHVKLVHADLTDADLQILDSLPKLRSLLIVKGSLRLPPEQGRPEANVQGWLIDLKWQDAGKSRIALLAASDGRLQFINQNSPIGSMAFHQLSLQDNLLIGTASDAKIDQVRLDHHQLGLDLPTATLEAKSLFFERDATAPFKFQKLTGSDVIVRTEDPQQRRGLTLECDTLTLSGESIHIGGAPEKPTGTEADEPESDQNASLVTIAYPAADLLGSYHKPIFPKASSNSDPDSRTHRASETLVQLITENIAPASWQQNGGDGTLSVHEETRTLVIRQRQAVHDQIAALLLPLRQLVIGPNADRAVMAFSTTSDEERPAELLVIHVAPDGRLSLNDDDTSISLPQIKSELQKRQAESNSEARKKLQHIQIWADRAVPYQELLKIINLGNELKLRLKFSLRVGAVPDDAERFDLGRTQP